MRIVCVNCKLELRPTKNGVRSIEHATFGPYKVWQSDRYGCPECGYEVLAGFAHAAVAEHYQPTFAAASSHAEIHFHASINERASAPTEKDSDHE